ncbi:MAG: hypothetical protein ACRC3Z_10120 [Phocaeicola sp.]
MKQSLFRITLLLAIVCLLPVGMNGQVIQQVASLSILQAEDSQVLMEEEELTVLHAKTPLMYRYDKRVNRYRQAFESLIPTNAILQFYGDMGIVSMGVGWDYGKRGEWETYLLFGVIPKYNSSETKMTMTLKQSYTPWSFYLGNNFSVEPLSCGLYFNTVFSEHFWVREPSRYPQGYYGFSTRIRSHVFLGQSVTYEIPHNRRFFTKGVSAFYEISSCDILIISAFTNSYLKPSDYLTLSFGLKFNIF